MLVLSRRVGESIYVGPGVMIRIVEAKGIRVRLAIDAPADVRIARGELEAPVELAQTPRFELAHPRCSTLTTP